MEMVGHYESNKLTYMKGVNPMKRNSIFACLLFSILLTACAGDGASSVTDAAGNETQAPETTAEEKLPFLPDGIDYGAEEYQIVFGNSAPGTTENEVTYELGNFEVGDIISEAVYERTRLAEEYLNIDIVSNTVDWDKFVDTLSLSVSANDSAFDICMSRVSNLVTAMFNGFLLDLSSMVTLDLSNVWWDQSVNRDMTLFDCQYLACGDINYYDDYSILCLTFNKRLFSDHDIQEPYNDVRNGTWTYEKLYQIINDTANDLDGNGKFDENDFYGITVNTGLLSSMMVGFGESLALRDDNGMFTLNMSPSIVDKATYVASQLMDNESVVVVERKLGYDLGDMIFPSGQALMGQALVGSIVSMRQTMEDDFGILPFPKWDENQKEYHSIASQHWASAVGVPKTCSDPEKAGYILDTLGYYSVDLITDAVIDKNVYVKSTRDEDSANMLNIIFDSKTFDPAVVLDFGPYGLWCELTRSQTPKISSTLERQSKAINKKIEGLLSALNEVE